MFMNPNFINVFEQKVAKCDDTCKHYYVKHFYKDNTEHYELHCNNHGRLITMPTVVAEEDIIEGGAIWITKGDPLPPF